MSIDSWYEGYLEEGWMTPLINGVTDGSGNLTSLILGDNVIDVTPKLYALGAQPYPWDVPIGGEVLVDPACLSGCGVTKLPITLVSDGDVLRVDREQVIYSKYALYSSYIAQLATADTGDVAFSLPGGNPKIPYGLLYLGIGMRIQASIKHASGATAPFARIYLGANGTVGDNIVMGSTLPSGGGEATYDLTIRPVSLGSSGKFVAKGTITDGKGGSLTNGSAFADVAFNSEVDNFFTIACRPNSQVVNVQWIRISLVP